ncbi:MAG: S8 family serine peptidase [Mycobacteriales bacterium]
MRISRTLLGAIVGSTILATFASGAAATASTTPGSRSTASTDYVVLYKSGVSPAKARADIAKAGGVVTQENTKLGYAFVRSSSAGFAAAAARAPSLDGAARNQVIGEAPKQSRARTDVVEKLPGDRAIKAAPGKDVKPAPRAASAIAPEPLADRQWDMRQIGATPGGSYAKNQGAGVRVGIIDTGIDGSHPDIAANFNSALSHNFVTDNPSIDGPCETANCVDPANVDDNGHGTHVASTVGAPINGIGIAGVAPQVNLVNIRAGQDSGYFFLQPTLQALNYAGDIGVDVVNMSFYTDPWLFNCVNNPADSPAEQSEQRVIRTATQRALNYALKHNVLPVAAEGNEATDLGKPTSDDTSPDFPAGAAKHRDIDNSCITVPTESNGVVAISSTGPSTRKAYYSNYGLEQTDVAAPGGDAYDSPDNRLNEKNLILAAYPANVAEANGDLNPDGTPNTPFVIQDCQGSVCAYYQYLQGTSMASPHAVGVAALVVGSLGTADAANGGKTLDPRTTRARLFSTAVAHACPQPRLFHYKRIRSDGSVAEADHYCAGPIGKNGFYGNGIVNAYRAATAH